MLHPPLNTSGIIKSTKSIILQNKKPLPVIAEALLRRMRDSNPHRLAPGGFQDRCNTNYANPPYRKFRNTKLQTFSKIFKSFSEYLVSIFQLQLFSHYNYSGR